MPAPRRPASIKEITEAFSDFSTADQEGLLSTLTEICRILKRERSRPLTVAQNPVSMASGAMQALPTEWLTAPDLALQQRIAGDTTPQEHEN